MAKITTSEILWKIWWFICWPLGLLKHALLRLTTNERPKIPSWWSIDIQSKLLVSLTYPYSSWNKSPRSPEWLFKNAREYLKLPTIDHGFNFPVELITYLMYNDGFLISTKQKELLLASIFVILSFHLFMSFDTQLKFSCKSLYAILFWFFSQSVDNWLIMLSKVGNIPLMKRINV